MGSGGMPVVAGGMPAEAVRTAKLKSAQIGISENTLSTTSVRKFTCSGSTIRATLDVTREQFITDFYIEILKKTVTPQELNSPANDIISISEVAFTGTAFRALIYCKLWSSGNQKFYESRFVLEGTFAADDIYTIPFKN